MRPSTKRPGRIAGTLDEGDIPGDGADDSEKTAAQAEPDSEVIAPAEADSTAEESASA